MTFVHEVPPLVTSLQGEVAARPEPGKPYVTQLTDGRWRPDSDVHGPFGGMQGGAAAAIMCAQVETARLGAITSFTAHFLRPVPVDAIQVSVEAVREGRRVSVFDVKLSNAGKLCAVARATMMEGEENGQIPMPSKEMFQPERLPRRESVPGRYRDHSFYDEFDVRESPDGIVWMRLRRPILAGQGPMSTVLPVADMAHGCWPPLGVEVRPPATFPNTDLTVHLFRAPVSGWIGMRSESAWSTAGVGTGWAMLLDESGVIGHVGMSIMVTLFEDAA